MHCHKVDGTNLAKISANWPKDSFVPTPGTFMTSPTGHASCVECHWKAPAPKEKTAFAVYEPYINSCSECHKNLLIKTPPKTATNDATKGMSIEKTATIEAQFVSAHAVVPALPPALSGVTEAWSARISPKFEHAIQKYDAKPRTIRIAEVARIATSKFQKWTRSNSSGAKITLCSWLRA